MAADGFVTVRVVESRSEHQGGSPIRTYDVWSSSPMSSDSDEGYPARGPFGPPSNVDRNPRSNSWSSDDGHDRPLASGNHPTHGPFGPALSVDRYPRPNPYQRPDPGPNRPMQRRAHPI